MTRKTFIIHDREQGAKAFNALLLHCRSEVDAGRSIHITARPPTRSLEANARMWALLTDLSEQIEWYGRRLSPTEWKFVCSAALTKQDVVPGIDGGFVVLGQSTSQMTSAEISDLMLLIESFGSSRGVKFSAPDRE